MSLFDESSPGRPIGSPAEDAARRERELELLAGAALSAALIAEWGDLGRAVADWRDGEGAPRSDALPDQAITGPASRGAPGIRAVRASSKTPGST